MADVSSPNVWQIVCIVIQINGKYETALADLLIWLSLLTLTPCVLWLLINQLKLSFRSGLS
jgi:hypothetical protein